MIFYPLDPTSLKLALFAFCMAGAVWALKRIRWSGEIAQLAAIQSVTCHTYSSGKCYAKLPYVTSSDGQCLLLRNILVNDLGCRDITEVAGGGEYWWDFTYRGRRFSCKLLPKSNHGSEIYRVGSLPEGETEDRLLLQLVHKISWNAAIKTGLACRCLLCL